MIQILPCTKCDRKLLLPMDVSLEALLECPHCRQRFVLGEMLASHFASWQVIDDPGVQSAQSETETDAGHLVSNAEPQTDAVGSEELALADEAPEPAAKPAVDWSNFKPITHDQYERMKRKSRSPIWSILQVVIGGVAAVPISLLLLWYVVGKDVGGAGPFVGEYAPWLVPERFRPLASTPDPADFSQRARRGDSGFRRFDEELGVKVEDEMFHDEMVESLDAGKELVDEPSLPTMEAKTVPVQSATEAANDATDTNLKGNSMTAASGQEEAAEPFEASPGGSIFELIQRCEDDLEQCNAMARDGGELRAVAQAVYSDLVDLAIVIDEFPEGNPVLRAVRDAMQPISRNIKRHAHLQQILHQGARFWSDKHREQDAYALAVIVELEGVVEESDAWRLTPSSATLPPTSVDTWLVPKYLAPALIDGQRLLLLGMVQSSEDSGDGAGATAVFRACYLHAL